MAKVFLGNLFSSSPKIGIVILENVEGNTQSPKILGSHMPSVLFSYLCSNILECDK